MVEAERWNRYTEYCFKRIVGEITLLGYQSGAPEPPEPLRRPPLIIEHRLMPFGSRTPKEARAVARAKNSEWATAVVPAMKIALTDLDNMCHRYGLTLSELLQALIPYYQPENYRARGRKLSQHAVRTHMNPRAYPGMGFPLERLAHRHSWRLAQKAALKLRRLVTKEEFNEWKDFRRKQEVLGTIRCNEVKVHPFDGGRLDDYVTAVDDTRARVHEILKRGILPYRVLPRREQ